MNIFLIETPHQLLHALEAKDYFSLADNILVVIIKDEYSRDSYSVLVERKEWDSVFYVSLKNYAESELLRKLKDNRIDRVRGYYRTYELVLLRKELNRISKSIGRVQKIFLGNYWIEYMRHFANVTRHEELLLLDDGTATLAINKMRKENWLEQNGLNLTSFRQRLINKIIGFKDHHSKNVIFFTVYDLDVRTGDRVIKHDYRYLKSKASERPIEDAVYFLGMTLIDEGLSQEKYLDYIASVKRYFSSENLVYVQHKGEPLGRIEIIKKELNLQVRKFNVPIEYQISVIGKRPKILSSFCSSALENCRVIFGDYLLIEAILIDPDDCSIRPDSISEIYAYYQSKESSHFKVIRIEGVKH